jgi:hypothetical protein
LRVSKLEHKTAFRKFEGRDHLADPLEDNIRIDLTEEGCEDADWIHLVWDGVQ